ncbi:hypothetical protein C9F11_38060 [Streptomyces sp. YIM 121038]|nr:hypothetical protein C9F11_38060 [Streptomyces sp. YIM 121038]
MIGDAVATASILLRARDDQIVIEFTTESPAP